MTSKPISKPPSARQLAKSLGQKRYFTGLPCKHGHIAERHTINGRCVECLSLSDSEKPENKRARAKKRYKENPEYFKEYAEKNKQKISKTKKEYAIKNKDKISQYHKLRYKENKEEHDIKCKQWKRENPEYGKMWRIANPGYDKIAYLRNRDKRIARQQARRAKTKNYDVLIVQKLGNLQKWKCPDCGCCIKEKNHLDHIMPLSLGGEHKESNLRLTCPSCNLKKHAKHPDEWAKQIGKLFL